MFPLSRLPLRRAVVAALSLSASLAFATGATGASAPSSAVPAPPGQATYSLMVVQTYADAPDVALPYADVLKAFLDAAGLHSAAADQPADFTIRVEATGEALARDYDRISAESGTAHAFSGATISGKCTVQRRGKKESEGFVFDGRWDPPDVIEKEFPNRADAPFIEPFGEFVFQAADWAGGTFGIKPLIAVLGRDPNDSLVESVPQLQIAAAEAAAKHGGRSVFPALRARFADGYPGQRAAAARGMRLAGDHDSLPDLVAALSEGDAQLKQEDHTARWARLIDLDAAVEPTDNADGEYDAGIEIVAAVAALYRVSDRPLLLTALKDKTSPMRRIDAAIVLGRAADKGAADALIAALKDDESLVRAAAANALGRLGDVRAIPALKAIAAGDEGGADVNAAADALDRIGARSH